MRTAAIILAAGYSSRMGRFKPLLPIGADPALALAAKSAVHAGADPFVVTGYGRDKLVALIPALGASEVFNKDFDQGMFSSIQAGVGALLDVGGYGGAMIWPCDCPLITPKIASDVIEKASQNPDCFVVACCGAKKGHPLFVPSSLFAEIRHHNGENGMKGVVSRHPDNMIRLETDDDRVLLDMDTPAGYERILSCAAEPDVDMAALMRTKRVWLMRHGETARHASAIFTGRYDVALSDIGRAQAAQAAQRLIRAGCRAGTVYTSPLVRAHETADIAAEKLGAVVSPVDGLSEMSLGAWDGRPISEIRESFPEAYALRGAQMPTYRIDDSSENFYDLRRRVKRAVINIFDDGKSDEILIVSHLGVMRALWSLANAEDMITALDRCHPEKGGILRL